MMAGSRKKPGVAFWATVVAVVLAVAYPLSFGPACWILDSSNLDDGSVVGVTYRPLFLLAEVNDGGVVANLIFSYSRLLAGDFWCYDAETGHFERFKGNIGYLDHELGAPEFWR